MIVLPGTYLQLLNLGANLAELNFFNLDNQNPVEPQGDLV